MPTQQTDTSQTPASTDNGAVIQEEDVVHTHKPSKKGSKLKKTANGTKVLPHKFRKSRRDPDRLRYIYMQQEREASCSSDSCCSSFCPCCTKEILLTKLSKCFPCCKKKPKEDDLGPLPDEDLYVEDDPLRKRCLRAFFNSVYVLLVLIAAVVTYSMIQDLITSMKNPVHSVHYNKVEDYNAPGKLL